MPRPCRHRSLVIHERPLPTRRQRIDNDQGRAWHRAMGTRHSTSRTNASLGSGHSRPKCLLAQTHRVEHFRRPQRCDDVGFAGPATDAQPLAERRAEVCAFRVVAAGDLLQVGETGPILDVQQRPRVDVPSDQVCPPRELVVLIRLIDPEPNPRSPQSRGLELAHRRMHQIRRLSSAIATRRRGSTSSIRAASQRRVPLRAAPSADPDRPTSIGYTNAAESRPCSPVPAPTSAAPSSPLEPEARTRSTSDRRPQLMASRRLWRLLLGDIRS